VGKCVAGDRNQSWEFLYNNKLRSAGANLCLGLPDPVGEGELKCLTGAMALVLICLEPTPV
jgi:hypothetical protein